MLLTRLIYTSQRLDTSPEGLSSILDSSLRNNAREGLTGALIVAGGQFAQILEGPRPELGACLARLQADRRHRDLQVVSASDVRHRLFPAWWMRLVEELDLRSALPAVEPSHGSFGPAGRTQLDLEELFRRLAVQLGRQGPSAPAAP